MIIIIILEVAAIALVWTSVASESMQEDVKLKAKNALQHITDDGKKKYFIDLLQRKLQCCGVDGPNDYSLDPAHPIPIPGSCLPKDSLTPYEKVTFPQIVGEIQWIRNPFEEEYIKKVKVASDEENALVELACDRFFFLEHHHWSLINFRQQYPEIAKLASRHLMGFLICVNVLSQL
ncbi:hypothetical protein AVEN_98565-1 [Araneus ventricosus]|uniref:Uncharacterized protein n=1 Tax=Araneus ventricosus TaxID=182803 RepID=A0A4Y2VX05_ARAVE|nr:hypothetical protein AVEN_98565-1 [Araneus ventricosus]